jgi:glycosyltransferase involved in cell wall biosynthesis
MVNVEAASVGVPIITFGTKSIPETVIDQHTGLVVMPKTSHALFLAICHLLTNRTLMHKMSNNGPTFAQKGYSFQSQAVELKRFYQELGILKR